MLRCPPFFIPRLQAFATGSHLSLSGICESEVHHA